MSRHRDVNAAKAFLRRAMKGRRVPAKVTLDAYAASHRAVADLKKTGELPEQLVVRSSKYLNNLIEQDHRRIKQRLRPMLGLKSFESATIVISGITVQVGAVTLGNGKWLFLRDLTGRPWRVESARMMGERFVGLRYAVK